MNTSVITVILASCFALSMARTVISDSKTQDIKQPDQKRCCFPQKWQGYMRQMLYGEGIPTMEVFYDYAVDSYKRKTAMRMVDPVTYQETSRNVIDFQKNVVYNITDGKCIKIPRLSMIEEPMMCLPEKAEYISDFFVGGTDDGWKASYWKAHNVSESTKYLEIAFTPSCVPVFRKSIVSYYGVELTLVENFADVASRIQTPDIFNVPGNCKDMTSLINNADFEKMMEAEVTE